MMTTLSSKTITAQQLAKVIDHSMLKPEMTEQDLIDGCELAAKYHTATVCVKPCHVKLAAKILRGTDVGVCTVIGFPHGSHLPAIKVAESLQAMDDGAVELDMVQNVGALRSGQADYVQAEMQAICDVAHARNVKVKVILENAYLTDDQKIQACQLAEAAGAAAVSEKVQVKAAGGVRTLDGVLAAIDAGCTRCGASATAAIMDEFEKRQREGLPIAGKADLGGGY